MQRSSPTVWRRWLAFELRRLRSDAEMSQQEVAKVFGRSTAKVSYIENAQQNISTEDLERLLQLYEVPEDKRPAFVDAAKNSRQKGWWERYDRRMVPDWLSLYVGLEQGASQLRVYEPLVIEGLLQTPDYHAALLRGEIVPRTEKQIAEIVELRTKRQDAVTRDEDPLELWVTLTEAALRLEVGGPEIMRAQLAHLADMAALPNVTVQIIPFSHGAHVGTRGAFKILDFGWEGDPGVVLIECRSGGLYLEAPHEIDEHTLAFQHLAAIALPPRQSAKMIRDTGKDIAT
ncbi:MAG: helix-turn-helix domain-containing protein [Acidimicrobiales bacterium]